MEKKKILFSVFLIVIFLNSIVLTLKNKNNINTQTFVLENQEYNSIEIKEEKQIDNNQKKKYPPDLVGKIIIPGTSINKEIVQGSNNEYYLNHSIYKEPNIHGSVFIDYRNTLTDRKLLIYGHNSQSLKNAPFHDLEKYLKKNFYKKNSYIDLNIENNLSKWQIFSIMIVEENDNRHLKITFNDKEWIDHINWMKDQSIYDTKVEVKKNDKIITLQTCYYKPKNSYLIINAKKIK